MNALATSRAVAAGDGYVYSRQYLTSRYGDSLRADVYFPAARDGTRARGKFPVILSYDFGGEAQRDAAEAGGQPHLDGAPLEYVRHKYVFVVVGQPGTGGSSGPQGIYDERVSKSGVDAVEWAGTRPWSTGAVGMYGQSGPGIAQPLVAQYRPRHLKTIVPVITTTDWHRDVLCRGGMPTSWERLVLIAAVVGNYNATNGITVPRSQEDVNQFADLWTQKLLNGWLPPSSEFFPRPAPSDPLAAPSFWHDFLTGCGAAEQTVSRHADVSRINVPVWSFGSWNDYFLLGNLGLYTDAMHSPYRRLTVDNVGHSAPLHGYDYAAQTLRWYDRWLKGVRNGIEKEPPLDYFSIERNAWHHASDWPIPSAKTRRLYLGGGAPASPLAKGGLTASAPRETGLHDSYVYDPLAGRHAGTLGILTAHADSGDSYCPAANTCVPGAGNDNVVARNQPNGPGDQRLDAAGSLVYLGDPLAADTEVTGPVSATLYASSSSTDTDWVVKLIDVSPDGGTSDPAKGPQPGYWGLATTGWLSGTRRSGDHRTPVPIPVGSVVKYRVSLLPTSYVFAKGHRIGVMIASADASRTYPNTNPATNTIYRSDSYPSHIDLPIVPARGRR